MAVRGRLFLVEEGMVSAKALRWAGRHCKPGQSTSLESQDTLLQPQPLLFLSSPGLEYPPPLPTLALSLDELCQFQGLCSPCIWFWDPGLGGQLGEFT